ncbi:hypothetical protein E3P99_02379 [Wallemia hederae]|uniref:Glyoxalase-like domain-containing protein n=1 Tax=Wallemia hederae TaxID=1540922 RepID=A0A4T0FMX6_9BASI|nr:hypothetical protein E3P99_02379 [Wallemia hederae]
MSLPSQPNIVDHLVFLTTDLARTKQRFLDAGFSVRRGGVHADGRTENELVIFADGTYIELIAFISDEHRRGHWWGTKQPGWIDWACLGVKENETGIEEFYESPKQGGRVLDSGESVKWRVSFPHPCYPRGSIPFYCGDITPRHLRVPVVGIDEHPNGAVGVQGCNLLCTQSALPAATLVYSSILRQEPRHSDSDSAEFSLDTPSQLPHALPATLTLRTPRSADEEQAVLAANGECLYQVVVHGSRGAMVINSDNQVTTLA